MEYIVFLFLICPGIVATLLHHVFVQTLKTNKEQLVTFFIYSWVLFALVTSAKIMSGHATYTIAELYGTAYSIIKAGATEMLGAICIPLCLSLVVKTYTRSNRNE